MCGIYGKFGDWPRVSVEAGLDRLSHRGPDGRGLHEIDGATHGHVRLSLVDLTDASAQPFRYQGGVLSYTGELWGHKALRSELEAAGMKFRTSGDTEVLAAALSLWGVPGALGKLDGMFAFAWSNGKGGHWVVRDAFGKVPIYAARKGKAIIWGSERKAFPLGVIPSAIPPGSTLNLTTGMIEKWYRLPSHPRPISVIDSLTEGVVKRLEADAPVCCLVSGGLDSSLVLALAVKSGRSVNAYTAVLDPTSPDLKAARELCGQLGVPLVEVRVPPPSAESLSEAARCIEIASKAQIEIAALCIPLAKRIASDGFKACLSGEAADELFGGYGSMCIKGSKLGDWGWRDLRIAQVAKMGRGNFVRCNKAFFAAGVECRLPFMEQSLVERVLSLGKAECPPGKRLLKTAASGVVPKTIISRQKETFQGGARMDELAALCVADPARFYKNEIRRLYGVLAME